MAESVAYMSGIMTLIMMTWCLAQAGSHRTANVVVGGTPAWLSTGAAAEQQQEQQSSRGAEHHHTHQGGSSVSSVSSSSSAESAELLPADVGGGGGTNSKMMIRKTRGNRPYDVPQIGESYQSIDFFYYYLFLIFLKPIKFNNKLFRPIKFS
uniref:Uncharacterized protein n=1 Tax=Rhodnius prolixus TaxID=13249 RepID=T1HUK0_RHOPR